MTTCGRCGQGHGSSHGCQLTGSFGIDDGPTRLDPPREAREPLEIRAGDSVGDYVILRQIGEGAAALVFEGIQATIGKRVAIKVLSADYVADPGLLKRFMLEARAVNKIRHRNIVDIFHYDQLVDGRPYLVMEFLEGMTLRRRMQQSEGFPLSEALEIIEAVCAALSAAHAQGIVHRDLKPENVFLCEDRSTATVKLLDFGIAKVLRPMEEGESSVTETGIAVGTPEYMAPEQCCRESVEPRTDLYSIGVMLYELVVGKRPFEGPSVYAIFRGHVSDAPVPPINEASIPEPLNALILACLAKSPRQRPESAAAVNAVLRRVRLSTTRKATWPVLAGAGALLLGVALWFVLTR